MNELKTAPTTQDWWSLPIIEFGLLPFRSPLLREYRLIYFLPVTEMFHFTGLPFICLCIQHIISVHDYRRVSPFGNLRIKTLIASYPKLIADYHVLHRLFVPRHPPYTLEYLTQILFMIPLSNKDGGYDCENLDILPIGQMGKFSLKTSMN